MTETGFPAPPADKAAPKRRFSPLLLVMILGIVVGTAGSGFGLFRLLGYHTIVASDEGSMSLTIPGGTGLVYRAVGEREIRRGALVVFDFSAFPDSGGERDILLKRVIGVAGDQVACCSPDVSRSITVNGKPVKEPYLAAYEKYGHPDNYEFKPVTVPPGSIFVAGDGRDLSRDSRVYVDAPGNGAIPLSKVYGVVVGQGNILTAEPIAQTTAFTDAGLDGAPLVDNGLRNARYLVAGGALVFLIGFIGAIVTVARSAGKRRKAAAIPPTR